ncbi:MAG: hypothetical protein QXR14_04925 [Sulfolobales archaeon]
MKTIGQVFQLKESLESLKSELIPSFDEVIRSYLGQHVRTRFKDPGYVVEVTFLTPPLQIFIKRILKALETPTVQGTYLIKGFGFGKTHAIILLWHMLNSKEGASSLLAKQLELDERIVRETLVLGIDFKEEQPFSRLFNQLKAIAKRQPEQWQIKDPKLSSAIIEVLREINEAEILSKPSEDFANVIVKILERYRETGADPKLLLLIDELGIGIIGRLTSYIESYIKTGRYNEEKYGEIEFIINFIEHLYTKLSGKGISAYIIVALAEQDIRELEYIYLQQSDKPEIREKIRGLQKRLDILRERLGRAAGGLGEEIALSYDLEHVINIAKHRVLKKIGKEVDVGEALLSHLALQAQQYNLQKTLEVYKEQIKNYYPLSPSMIWLFRKILNPYDVPRTEYVRTVINILARAAEEALKHDVQALSIGVKHLPLGMSGVVDLMGEFEVEWASAISDIEHTIRSANPEIQKTVEVIAKEILAKGTTANVLALIELKDAKEIKAYGVSLEEIQIDILATLPPEEASKTIAKLQDAIEYLKTQSARIDEKEYDAQKFYIPSPMRTIYDKLAAFVVEQRKVLEEPLRIPAYLQDAGLPSLFYNPRVAIPAREGEVKVLLKDYNTVENVEELINSRDLREAQNEGKLSIVVVPPWDSFLFYELYQRNKSYHVIVKEIARKLENKVMEGEIARQYHLLILVPNISKDKLAQLIDDAISYMAVKNFIDHLKNKEKILEEKMSDYERTIKKRLTQSLMEYFEEQRKKLEAFVDRQVRDARLSAQRELIKLSRKIATDVIELFEDVIFYSMQSEGFTTQSLVKLFGELSGEASKLEENKKSSLSEYSLIMNMFFRKVVESTWFTWDPKIISDAIYRRYKMEIENNVFRESDRISEIIENAMLGTYGVKPLSVNVVREAISMLNEKTIEVKNRRVILKVDEKADLIFFKEEIIEEVKPVEETIEIQRKEQEKEVTVRVDQTRREEKVVEERDHVVIEIGRGFDYEDFKRRLSSLSQTPGVEIKLISINAFGDPIEATLKFKGSKHEIPMIISATRFLVQISEKYNVAPQLEIMLTKPLPEDKLKEILGPFYIKKVSRSWDKFLPT